MPSHQPFPFWKLAFSIATGLLLAGSVIDLRARWELNQTLRVLNQQQAEIRAASIKRQQAQAAQRASAQQALQRREWASAQKQAAETDEFRRRRARDDTEGEYFPLASDAMPVDTFACKDRFIVRKTVDGWQQTELAYGVKARCRTAP